MPSLEATFAWDLGSDQLYVAGSYSEVLDQLRFRS